MRGVILSFFPFVLRVPSKLTPDTIDKSLGILKVLSKQGLKLKPCGWNDAFVATLVLGPTEADNAAKKG